jgi:outer membrane protein OmpA-like peptidoglycan-associated protein
MKILLFSLSIFLVFLSLSLNAQNLVQNPSFEQAQHCISQRDVEQYDNVPSLTLSKCLYWSSFSEEGTADLFQPCNDWSVGKMVQARSGVAYAGLYAYDSMCCGNEYREYLVGSLKSPLEKGKTYEMHFWVRLLSKSNVATSSLGVYFSQDSLYKTESFYGVAPFQAQAQQRVGNILKTKSEWVEVNFTYKAQGAERYFMIGNFLNDKASEFVSVPGDERYKKESYYLIDDVCISAQNCEGPIALPTYGFKAYTYEEGSNTALVGAKVELQAIHHGDFKETKTTEYDGKVRFQVPENTFLCYASAPCYLPYMQVFEAPLIRDGEKLSEQMRYLPLTPEKPGAKIIICEDYQKLLSELNTEEESLQRLHLRLDKIALYLKANTSLQVSFNATANLNRISSEERRTQAQTNYTKNLEYIKTYLINKGVNASQLKTKMVELSEDVYSVSGNLDGYPISKSANRYEMEVLQTNCKSVGTTTVFFDSKEKGNIYILDKVYFKPDSPELDQRSFEELDQLAAFLLAHTGLKVRINGHTDIGKANGSFEFLQTLSENRAKAVADYLISKGVTKANISWQGFANTRPIADNNTEEGKAKNRRVEVEIME